MISISRDGEIYGPYAEPQIKDLLASGDLVPDDVAWREGDAETRRLGDLVAAVRPLPLPAEAPEETYLKEGNILVTSKRIVIGAQTFAVKNVGGVGVEAERRGRIIPILLGVLVLGPIFGGDTSLLLGES